MVRNVDNLKIALPYASIAALCERFGVRELSVFGSVLREGFNDSSDVDFLVAFKDDDYGPWMSKLTELEEALSRLLHRKVDLATRPGVEGSENYIRRRHILDSIRVIYAAG